MRGALFADREPDELCGASGDERWFQRRPGFGNVSPRAATTPASVLRLWRAQRRLWCDSGDPLGHPQARRGAAARPGGPGETLGLRAARRYARIRTGLSPRISRRSAINSNCRATSKFFIARDADRTSACSSSASGPARSSPGGATRVPARRQAGLGAPGVASESRRRTACRPGTGPAPAPVNAKTGALTEGGP